MIVVHLYFGMAHIAQLEMPQVPTRGEFMRVGATIMQVATVAWVPSAAGRFEAHVSVMKEPNPPFVAKAGLLDTSERVTDSERRTAPVGK